MSKEAKVLKLNEQKKHNTYYSLMIPFWCNGASIEFSTICMNWNFAFNCAQIPTQLQVLLLNNGAVKCFHRWFLLYDCCCRIATTIKIHFWTIILKIVEKRWQPKQKNIKKNFTPLIQRFGYLFLFLFFFCCAFTQHFLYKFVVENRWV